MDVHLLLGRNVARIRQSKGISQSELSRMLGGKKLGVDQPYISLLEAGQKNPTVSTLKVIADALGVSLQDLFDIQESNTAAP